MYQHCSSNDTTLWWLIAEQSPWWKVRSRTRPGQEYSWVAINHNELRVGAVPVKSSQRYKKIVDSNTLSDDDWFLNSNCWDMSCPYRAYILLSPDSTSLSHWMTTLEAQGQNSVNMLSAWHLDPDMVVEIVVTTENAHALMDQVPLHYQWLHTDIGPLDPRTLKATDYDNFNWEKHQTQDTKIDEKQHGEIKKPGRVAKVVKGKAQYYRMSNKGRNKTLISRAEYKRLSQSCHAERLNLPTREVCTIFEDNNNNNNNNEASGPAIMMVNGAACWARLTAGVMTTQAVHSQTQT
ncbi:hypothetical protein EDD22DRAFT_847617 [Suillus occidentalis]|nr:hypothetical protein EDD22DRAFT_847617 [Suillus occidentalis]